MSSSIRKCAFCGKCEDQLKVSISMLHMKTPSASRTTDNKAAPLLSGHSGGNLERSSMKQGLMNSSLHSSDDPLCCRIHLVEVFHIRFPI